MGSGSVVFYSEGGILLSTVLAVRRGREDIYVVWIHTAWARVAVLLLQSRTGESTRDFNQHRNAMHSNWPAMTEFQCCIS